MASWTAQIQTPRYLQLRMCIHRRLSLLSAASIAEIIHRQASISVIYSSMLSVTTWNGQEAPVSGPSAVQMFNMCSFCFFVLAV